MSPMAKIWRNRIEAGTQLLKNCPTKYRADVITLIQEDLESGAYTKEQLKQLVADGKMYKKDYKEITGEAYVDPDEEE